jgi:hypothetical protein
MHNPEKNAHPLKIPPLHPITRSLNSVLRVRFVKSCDAEDGVVKSRGLAASHGGPTHESSCEGHGSR